MDSLAFRNILHIPKTVGVVANCWRKAEQNLQADIKEDFPSVNEEFITQMFHGKLAKALKKASRRHVIEQAFLDDLTNAFYYLGINSELNRIAHGLVANVTLHKRETEEATGGDMGFVIVRPQIKDSGIGLNIDTYRRGMLCQAKIKRADGKWGKLSPLQKKVLPERLQYSALLLYKYSDDERRILTPFQWQLCDSASSITEVSSWLQRESFPSLIDSEAVITGVGHGRMGTDNDKILDEVVAPAGNSALVITIGWSDDDHPGSEVYVSSRESQEQKERDFVHVRVR